MESKLGFTLTQLEYVIALYKHGHFARAAAACHVTQPTLSMQIQKLEEVLGVTLFDRSKKPILVTEAGRRLIPQFQNTVFEAKKISDLIQTSPADKMKGLLVVGIIPTVAPYVLPKLLPIIERDYRGLELQIQEMQTQQILQSLGEDEIDVGLLATPLEIPQINEHPLYYEPFEVLCRRDHPLAKNKRLTYKDLKEPDIWLLTEGHCLRHQVLDLCSLKKANHRPRAIEFESGSLETLKSLVDSCGGYTLLPEMAHDTIGKNSTLLSFGRPIPARQIGLVYRRRQYKTELIEILAEAVLKAIPEHLRLLRQKDLDVLPIESEKS